MSIVFFRTMKKVFKNYKLKRDRLSDFVRDWKCEGWPKGCQKEGEIHIEGRSIEIEILSPRQHTCTILKFLRKPNKSRDNEIYFCHSIILAIANACFYDLPDDIELERSLNLKYRICIGLCNILAGTRFLSKPVFLPLSHTIPARFCLFNLLHGNSSVPGFVHNKIL